MIYRKYYVYVENLKESAKKPQKQKVNLASSQYTYIEKCIFHVLLITYLKDTI